MKVQTEIIVTGIAACGLSAVIAFAIYLSHQNILVQSYAQHEIKRVNFTLHELASPIEKVHSWLQEQRRLAQT